MGKALRVIVIHGTGGNPERNWFPWLSAQLLEVGVPCVIPKFPTPEGQSLDAWLRTLQKSAGALRPTDILIGHSIGAAFVLRVLERLDGRIFCAALVASFVRRLGLPDFDPLNATFVEPPFDWEKIRSSAAHFKVYSGDNDPYVPLSYGQETAGALEVPLTVVPGGGHLNAESGYTSFPLLLAEVRALTLAKVV